MYGKLFLLSCVPKPRYLLKVNINLRHFYVKGELRKSCENNLNGKMILQNLVLFSTNCVSTLLMRMYTFMVCLCTMEVLVWYSAVRGQI